MDVKQAEELAVLAKKKKLVLMVGHVFMFNSGIQRIKEYIDDDYLGSLYSISSIRTNLDPIREDVNSVWDLASHDVSIFNYLLNSVPNQVTGKGESFLQDHIEDITFIIRRGL